MIERIYTIGVYGKTESEFFGALTSENIQVFCDVRRRRGVRGPQYAFVNSAYLQRKLLSIGIDYRHFIELAPSLDVRGIQHSADRQAGDQKRSRTSLADTFVNAYSESALRNFDSASFLRQFSPSVTRIALFCVEASPTACHRSIISAKLHKDLTIDVEHL